VVVVVVVAAVVVVVEPELRARTGRLHEKKR
jgi:hypothetical protein